MSRIFVDLLSKSIAFFVAMNFLFGCTHTSTVSLAELESFDSCSEKNADLAKVISDLPLKYRHHDSLQKISCMMFVNQRVIESFDKSSIEVMALTRIYPNGKIRILISKELERNPRELQIFVLHELLHIVGFDHPKQPCNWLSPGCGIMGQSPGRNMNISAIDHKRLIELSLSDSYLDKIPKHEWSH